MTWPIAFSFAEWLCADCRNVVRWSDAVVEEVDGRLVAIRHLECSDG